MRSVSLSVLDRLTKRNQTLASIRIHRIQTLPSSLASHRSACRPSHRRRSPFRAGCSDRLPSHPSRLQPILSDPPPQAQGRSVWIEETRNAPRLGPFKAPRSPPWALALRQTRPLTRLSLESRATSPSLRPPLTIQRPGQRHLSTRSRPRRAIREQVRCTFTPVQSDRCLRLHRFRLPCSPPPLPPLPLAQVQAQSSRSSNRTTTLTHAPLSDSTTSRSRQLLSNLPSRPPRLPPSSRHRACPSPPHAAHTLRLFPSIELDRRRPLPLSTVIAVAVRHRRRVPQEEGAIPPHQPSQHHSPPLLSLRDPPSRAMEEACRHHPHRSPPSGKPSMAWWEGRLPLQRRRLLRRRLDLRRYLLDQGRRWFLPRVVHAMEEGMRTNSLPVVAGARFSSASRWREERRDEGGRWEGLSLGPRRMRERQVAASSMEGQASRCWGAFQRMGK